MKEINPDTRRPTKTESKSKRLVEAEGRCPPEDVGGPPGYEHLLEVIAHPRHPDHDEMLE